MKRINLIFVMLVLSGLFTIQSCKKDATVPFVEKASFTIPTQVSPGSGFLSPSGSTVNLTWESTNADGAPQKWDVYFGTAEDPALIQSGYTQQTISVNVLKGYKYFWRVVGTDLNGVITRGPVWSFEIVDPAALLNLKMTWTTDAKAVVGLDIAPEKAVALRLLILKADQVTTATPIISTGGFEEFGAFNTLPDGIYYIVTDIASTANFNNGSANVPYDISINLQFLQRGTVLDPALNSYAKSIDFTNIMTNENNCSSFKTVLAKVTKAGTVYTIDKSVKKIIPPIVTWKGTDGGSTSQVTTTSTCTATSMTGLGFGWMLDYWGEVIISGGKLIYTISGNTITIPLQPYCSTTYLGKAQTPYYIQGTGTINNSGAFPVWTIHYDFKQGNNFIVADPANGWPTPYLEAIITTNPAKGFENIVMPVSKRK